MQHIKIVDRETQKEEIEEIYGKIFLQFFYGKNVIAKFLLPIISKNSIASWIYGLWNKTLFSTWKIKPFIRRFKINTEEFVKEVKTFTSFNDFFVRELKKEKRPIQGEKKDVIIPADGRILVFPKINDGFYVKGQKFYLDDFLQDQNMAEKYEDGSMAILRLSPVDLHRFYFPIDCRPSKSKNINGYLFSVSPLALKKNINILWQNKRQLTILQNDIFGNVLFVEIGAFNVGSINQTFIPGKYYKKGEEKGFFSLGGSSIVMIFERGKIIFSSDLLKNSKMYLETKVKLGQILSSKKNT